MCVDSGTQCWTSSDTQEIELEAESSGVRPDQHRCPSYKSHEFVQRLAEIDTVCD